MSGFATEEAEGGGLGHVFAGVDDLTRAEVGEELVVANLIHVVFHSFFRADTPDRLSLTVLDGAASGGEHGAVFTVNTVGDITVSAIHLALSDVGDDAVRVFVSDIVVVEDVGLVITLSAATVSNGGDGRDVIHGPTDFVDGVDTLLDERGGAKPLEVLPVAHLEFDITHPVGLLHAIGEWGNRVEHVSAVNGHHFAKLTGEDFFVSLLGAGMVAPAKAVLDCGAFGLGHLGGLEDGADAGHVDGHGLLDKGVLASFHGSAEVLGAEVGRGAEEDDVHSGGDDTLISIKADELALFGSLHAAGVGLLVSYADGVVDATLEGITDGPEDDVWVGGKGLGESAAATTTAADDADLDLVRRILRLEDGGDGGGE